MSQECIGNGKKKSAAVANGVKRRLNVGSKNSRLKRKKGKLILCKKATPQVAPHANIKALGKPSLPVLLFYLQRERLIFRSQFD